MKPVLNYWIKLVIHWEVTVDESDFARMLCYKPAQEKMHFFTLEALVIRKLHDLKFRVSGTYPWIPLLCNPIGHTFS